ncbi:Gfo/Idh/MocA family protein [Brenneria tiliae]|uniref:Gfo/Idh/MocA family protein n=1 Tax=Brenneria tiliae TaxID=2914984 RepID=UPI002014EB1B|nr:Gfo/Idh/MocA family oxidoreductase [Brenneria tiliae]MCL2897117.1 Gfo/Idh/MocA family oxidoreductase [Brenneria tiliae]MCL2904770.1 Gfo/Idh/MocA family oxidoreductase [Brenneria tiliae]
MHKIMIVGYGFAGNNLHHRCISKMMRSGWNYSLSSNIVVIDKLASKITACGNSVKFYTEIPPVTGGEGCNWIVHICTPPEQHFQNIHDALCNGYRSIIVEKPAASTYLESQQLIELERDYNAKILVVANWVSCAAVNEIMDVLKTGDYGVISQITVVQNKSRFIRSRERKGEHLFDIEMPHQVALALFLGGNAALESAEVEDMVMPDMTLPNLGYGSLRLSHINGVKSVLRSSLIHPVRERYLKIRTSSGYMLKIYFPTGGDDSYSRLLISSPANEVIINKILYDDPLTLCLIRAYKYFLESQQNPYAVKPSGMDLEFNANKVKILEEAKELALYQKQGIRSQHKIMIVEG